MYIYEMSVRRSMAQECGQGGHDAGGPSTLRRFHIAFFSRLGANMSYFDLTISGSYHKSLDVFNHGRN